MAGAPGVFEVGAEGGIGQPGATVELVVLQLRKHAEALRIALEIEEVGTLVITHVVQPPAPGRLLEPVTYGVFARMAEWRVADVVGQAGRLHDHPQVAGRAPVWQAFAQGFTHAHAQRTPHATDFQRMGQARVNVIVTGDGVHLGLAPQAAKGARENDAVVVFVEGAAPEFIGAIEGFAQAFAGEQGVPVQGAVSRGSKAIASGVLCLRASGRGNAGRWHALPANGRWRHRHIRSRACAHAPPSAATATLQVQAHQRQQAGAQAHKPAQVTAAHALAGHEAQGYHSANAPQRRVFDAQAVVQRAAHAAHALQRCQQLPGFVADLLAVHFHAQAQQRLAQLAWVSCVRQLWQVHGNKRSRSLASSSRVALKGDDSSNTAAFNRTPQYSAARL